MKSQSRSLARIALALLALTTAAVNATADTPAPEYSRAGADTCLGCHREPALQDIFQTPHGVTADANSPFGQQQCESCHGPRGKHPAGGPDSIRRFGKGSALPAARQNEGCLGCHAAVALPGWHGGVHEAEDLACADCHRVHVVADPVLSLTGQPEICLGCHRRERAQMLKPYVHPVRYGKMNCSGCHAPHGSATQAELRRPTLNETCFECHAEKRGPFVFEHAPATEDCSLCHNAHGSNHPAMLTRRAPLLCQQCHSQAGHPSLSLTAAGLPGGSPSALVVGGSCLNCHGEVHGSNHPSGITQMR